ncbi:DnaJ domain-containing protein [Sphingomonas sp. PAMC 26621]|uniref:DnaJ domain-containing protein n=1 Tax=Sphingomonas sp. PAMC 26621 TaxID=1112213 RepID=UPI0002883FB3|nr:DnaJ domain-containing protein [Sphingomonas sp. PAMC 26621]
MSKVLLLVALLVGVWLLLLRPRPKAKPRPQTAESEARAVLGVGPTADAAAIRAAHRRLVTSLHPDKGGSAELTRRINAARDVLLKP